MVDLVTSLVAGFVGGVFGAMLLGPVGFVGGVAAGLSLGFLSPRHEQAAERRTAGERPRIPLVGRRR